MMDINVLQEIMGVIKEAGWIGVALFGLWMLQRLIYVSVIGFSVYKVVSKVIELFSGRARSLETRLAAALGVTTPLKDKEIQQIVKGIKREE